VKIKAIPQSTCGWSFYHWEGKGNDAYGNSIEGNSNPYLTLVMDNDRKVVAVFDNMKCPLEILAAPSPPNYPTNPHPICGDWPVNNPDYPPNPERYGVMIIYNYISPSAKNWWFWEEVNKLSDSSPCDTNQINDNRIPQRRPNGDFIDQITNSNGYDMLNMTTHPDGTTTTEPASIPCTTTTQQIIHCGPTQAAADCCRYKHKQVIHVMYIDANNPSKGKRVISTISPGGECQCPWTP
jgi:hypothetical protein